MKKPVTIRLAEERDMPSVYDLICAEKKPGPDYATMREVFRENLKSSYCIYLVAETTQRRIVGFAGLYIQHLLHHSHKTGTFYELYVNAQPALSHVRVLLLKAARQKAFEQNCHFFETAEDCSTHAIQSLRETKQQS